jgi:hypothetical protein
LADLPKPPTQIADVALAQEIRQHVRGQKSPLDFAVKSISDARVVGAVLNAPPFLSGLSETESTYCVTALADRCIPNSRRCRIN